ncbi:MAG: hypothetical protein U0172_04695 [Nitrospiraceae bacterium]
MFLCIETGLASAASQPQPPQPSGEVVLFLGDAMARPNRSVTIHADLVRVGAVAKGIGGEQVRLLVDGTEVATTVTDEQGHATFRYEPRRLGLHQLTATGGPASTHTISDGRATLAVWEKRKPLLLVEDAVLSNTMDGRQPSEPNAGAVEDLSRLSHFFYNLVYLVTETQAGSPLSRGAAVEWMRRLLSEHRFPPGIVLSVPPTDVGIADAISRLKDDGWENLRAGVGRSQAFAQALVGQRLRTVIHTPVPGAEYPRKARLVTDWTAVRKELQD